MCLQVIGDVLDKCGSNIDAASKRLEQLRLSGNNAPEAAQDPTAADREAGVLNCRGGSSLCLTGCTLGPHLCSEGTRPMPSCCGKQSCPAELELMTGTMPQCGGGTMPQCGGAHPCS